MRTTDVSGLWYQCDLVTLCYMLDCESSCNGSIYLPLISRGKISCNVPGLIIGDRTTILEPPVALNASGGMIWHKPKPCWQGVTPISWLRVLAKGPSNTTPSLDISSVLWRVVRREHRCYIVRAADLKTTLVISSLAILSTRSFGGTQRHTNIFTAMNGTRAAFFLLQYYRFSINDDGCRLLVNALVTTASINARISRGTEEGI
jgi:hypothetical protein